MFSDNEVSPRSNVEGLESDSEDELMAVSEQAVQGTYTGKTIRLLT